MQVGGKPSGSWQAFIPVTFEVTILCAALGCFIGLWVLCALPDTQHATLKCRQFDATSDDAVFVSVETNDPKFSLARAVLRDAGALDLIEVDA
jgi:hypothetical protein